MFKITKLSFEEYEISHNNSKEIIHGNFSIKDNKICPPLLEDEIHIINSDVVELSGLSHISFTFVDCKIKKLTINDSMSLNLVFNYTKIEDISFLSNHRYFTFTAVNSALKISSELKVNDIFLNCSKVTFKKISVLLEATIVKSKININSFYFNLNSEVKFKNQEINNFKPLKNVCSLSLNNVKTKGFNCFLGHLKTLTIKSTKIKEIDRFTPEILDIIEIKRSPIKKIGVKKIVKLVSDKIFDEENLSVYYYEFKNTLRKNIVIKKTKVKTLQLSDSYVENIEVDADLEIDNCPFIRNNSQLKVKKIYATRCSSFNNSFETKKRFLPLCEKCNCFIKKGNLIKTFCGGIKASIIIKKALRLEQLFDSSVYEYLELPQRCPYIFEHKVELT